MTEHQPIVIDRLLGRRGRIVNCTATTILIQWSDRHGVQSVPADRFTDDRYDMPEFITTNSEGHPS